MTLEQQVQESAERIEKLEVQRREIQWKIALEQRNFERLRILERFESERSILAAKAETERHANKFQQAPKVTPFSNPNAGVVQAHPEGRYATKEDGGV